jgi:hypothetical protein
MPTIRISGITMTVPETEVDKFLQAGWERVSKEKPAKEVEEVAIEEPVAPKEPKAPKTSK